MIDIYYYDGEVKQTQLDELEKLRGKKVWVDMANASREEIAQICRFFDIHPLTEEDIFNTHVRIKIEEFPHYLFCAFYGVRKAKNIEMHELDFVLGPDFLISNHEREITSYNELKSNHDRLTYLFQKGAEFILHQLLEDEIDHYYPVLDIFDEQLDHIEDEITRNPKSELLVRILKLKRQIHQIKKHTLPQREKISMLAKQTYSYISPAAVPYFRDVYDHSVRVSDSVENYREAVSNTFEAYMSAVNNKMSETMKGLSIIATIALPLTVISSIYGTNFKVLPGASNPYGFWIMIGLMILMSLGMQTYFRRKGWF
jgi:magnesium transporter